MPSILPELVIGPLLVGGSTLAARRWGSGIGGLVSAFPAVVGPVLLIAAQRRGDLFAARAADGTLLGLVALSVFVLVYARVALRARWGLSLLAGWACASSAAMLVGSVAGGGGLVVGAVVATGSLTLAYLAMPRVREAPGVAVAAAGDDLVLRMVMTAALVATLATVAILVGPLVGGMLTALPVLASVLAVFTHRRAGPDALVAMLRGMIAGMAGFVGFCAVVGGLLVPLGTGPAFAGGTVAAVVLQVLMVERRPRPLPT